MAAKPLSAIRVAVLYALLGAVWIALTDRILARLATRPGALVSWQTYKGWLFVAGSAAIVYMLAARERYVRRAIDRERAALLEREQSLRAHAVAEARWASFLAEASRALAGSLDPAVTLAEVARLAVAEIADWCVIYLPEPDGRVTRFQVRHRDPAKTPAVRAIREHPIDPAGNHPVLEVLRTGRPLLLAEVDDRVLASVTEEGTHRELVRELGLTSGMYVPLAARGHVLGAVAFLSSDPARRYSESDLRRASELAARAALAMDNARLFAAAESARESAEAAARQIQRQLERLDALRSIDVAITGSVDLRVMLAVILDQVTARLGVDAAAILLLDRHSHRLTYAAGRGFRTAGLARTDLGPGECLAGRAALSRTTVRAPDLRREPGYTRAALVAGEDFVFYIAAPLVSKAELQGVLELYHRAPLEPDPEWLAFLDALASQSAIAIESAALFDALKRSNAELEAAYDLTLAGWSRALELRDLETQGHTERVTTATVRLARAMGFDEAALVHVRRGALLHDIGKMGIPDAILLKPGPLTEDEWAIMRRHPSYAYELLAPIPYLRPALDIPHYHHERWDGTGYPHGLKGEAIPLVARIFAVVDVWDALRSRRPYREPWPEERVRAHIRSLAGSHFDPKVVEAFLALEPEALAPVPAGR